MFGGDSLYAFGGKKTHRDLGGEPQGRHILFEISSIFLLSERIFKMCNIDMNDK